jgi:RNA polymerase-binding transcription factor DksA
MPTQSKVSTDRKGADSSQERGLLKHRLVSRRRELVERVHAVEQDLERVTDPASTDRSERAVQRANDEVLEAIGEADAHELAAIDAALHRLELGTYGPCTRCGRLIAAERLRALPHVGYCEKCALVSDAQHRTAR